MTYLDAVYPPQHAEERGDNRTSVDVRVPLGIELESFRVVVRCPCNVSTRHMRYGCAVKLAHLVVELVHP